MKFTESELNVGILIQALYEKTLKGFSSYKIHPVWIEISDMDLLNKIVSNGFLKKDKDTISFTPAGKKIIKNLRKENKEIPITKVYSTLLDEAAIILKSYLSEDY